VDADTKPTNLPAICNASNKIQLRIADVCSMNLFNSTENNKATLDLTLELRKPPEFFRKEYSDKENKPWDFGSWTICPDFTHSQASTYKRHRVRFLEGDAKKVHSLLNTNEHFKELMQHSESGGFSFFMTKDDLTFSKDDGARSNIRKTI